MKISRRSVLRYTGLTAAWLTLTGCAPTGVFGQLLGCVFGSLFGSVRRSRCIV